ncbi:MAG: hypothetical protein QOF60_747 [Actinomycetota bacterium]|jgi:hypothetical protein|nr:hypothetical protein [Actinomycetota bacterium]
MPEDRDSVQVKVELEGAHLRVDARPARLVSQLRGGDGEPMVTAQPHGGDGLTESVPAAARQVTMRVSDELSVEATRAADFVALADEGSGRRLVVAFTGEVTVLPKGAGGDRFALSAHEALLVPAGGGEPRVVPLAELSDEEQGEITSAVEAASLAVAAPSSAETPAVETPAAAEPSAEPEATTGDIVPGEATRVGPPTATPTPTPAKAGGGSRPSDPPRRGKKGKKGRPQPPPAKKAAPIIPAAAAAAGAGTAAAAASAAKKGAPPIKKATTAPAKKATSGGPTKGGGGGNANRGGGGGGGGGRGGSDSPGGDRRFVLGAIALAALVAIVLAVFVLTGNNGDKTAVDTTTTTTTTAAAAATTTTAAAAATTTAKPAVVTTTTAKPAATTTTAKPAATTTTAKPAVAANYAIEPKTCVQNGNSITYTATLTNKASAAFDFTVRVVFKDSSGAAVASSDAAVNKVGPNKSVDFTATGTTSRNLANSGANCTVERVDAHPSA